MPQALHAARSIDEVVERLDGVIEQSLREQSRLAYFACLYRGVTRRVRDAIAEGRFEDGPRMERLDVIFANRYLDALAAYRRGERATRSWMAAFGAARSGRPIILQHLVLGMNAHINLDLGIAAAQTSPGPELAGLRHDFDEISNLLGEMLDAVQDQVSSLSPWLGLVDRVGCRNDEEVFGFGLRRARDVAWRSAQRLAALSAAAAATELDRMDRRVAVLAHPIRWPGLKIGAALLCIRARESRDLEHAIRVLGG